MTMTKLFVGNLSSEVTQADLRAAFAAYGPVSSADIVVDRSDGKSKGFGFIEMSWQAHAVAAIQGLNGTDLKEGTITAGRANRGGGGGAGGMGPPGGEAVGAGGNAWYTARSRDKRPTRPMNETK